MFLMWVSIARSYDSKAIPWRASRSCERVKIRPGWPARVASSWNSVGVSSIWRSPSSSDERPVVSRAAIRAVDASQDGLDPGDELAGAERLGQIVVGAELEPEKLVELVVACRQHHDRQGRIAPDFAGHVEPVELRQPEIEDDEVRPLPADSFEGSSPRRSRDHREAGMLEVVAGKRRDLWFIIDDEDRLHRKLIVGADRGELPATCPETAAPASFDEAGA